MGRSDYLRRKTSFASNSPGHPSNQSNLSIANTTGNTDTSGDYSNNPSMLI